MTMITITMYHNKDIHRTTNLKTIRIFPKTILMAPTPTINPQPSTKVPTTHQLLPRTTKLKVVIIYFQYHHGL